MEIDNTPQTEPSSEPKETKKSEQSEKQKTAGRRNIRTLIALIVLVVIVITAAAVVIVQIIRNKNNGDGVPYVINAETVADIRAYSSGVAILTSNALHYVDQHGNLLNTNEHSYNAPVLVTSNKNALLFDRGGNVLRIEKNAVKFKELQFDSSVTCADITDNGTYVYVLNADAGHQSHLFAFSNKGKKLFEWSGADYVLDVSLSPNGKSAAVCLISVNNAESLSKVVFFNFSKNEPVFTVELPGENAYKTEFISQKKLCVFTEKNTYLLETSGDKDSLAAYSSNELKHTDMYKEGMGVSAANLYGNNNNVKIYVFNKGFKDTFEHTYTMPVNVVAAGENAVAFIFGNEIEIYNSKDVMIGHIKLSEVCLDSVISGNRIYLLTSNCIYNYSIYSMSGEDT